MSLGKGEESGFKEEGEGNMEGEKGKEWLGEMTEGGGSDVGRVSVG